MIDLKKISTRGIWDGTVSDDVKQRFQAIKEQLKEDDKDKESRRNPT